MKDNRLLFKDLTVKDVDAIMLLQEKIFDSLETPDLLRRNSREMFEKCVQEPNWTFGAFDPDFPERLVGVAIMFDPGDSNESLTDHLVRHTLKHAANAKLAMILPEFRGRGFEKTVLIMMKERAECRGYDGLCATVSPQNVHSRESIIASGFEYDHTQKKYGGMEREVWCQVFGENDQLRRNISGPDHYKTMIYREIKTTEYDLLKDFLYEAIFIPEGVSPPDRAIIYQSELSLYYEDFGSGRADHCIVVEDNGRVVGAVWTRIMDDYGHVDDETPSFAISLYKEYRGKGYGTELMLQMLELLRKQGYRKVSLAVQKANYAVKMYKKLGFRTTDENAEEYIMVREL